MLRLGELLLEDNRISPEQLDHALALQAVHGGRLGQTLIRLGFATQEQVTSALARKYGVPSVDLERLRLSRAVCRLLPLEQAIRYRSLPISRDRRALEVAMVDPTDVAAIDEIQFLTGCTVRSVLASENSLVKAIYENLGGGVVGPFLHLNRKEPDARRELPGATLPSRHDDCLLLWLPISATFADVGHSGPGCDQPLS